MTLQLLPAFSQARAHNLVSRELAKQTASLTEIHRAATYAAAPIDTAVRGIGAKRAAQLASRNITDVMAFVSASPAAIAGAFASIADPNTRQTETAIVLNLHASLCACFGAPTAPRRPIAEVGFAACVEHIKEAKARAIAPRGDGADAAFTTASVHVLKGIGPSSAKLLERAGIKSVLDLANASGAAINEALRAHEPGGVHADVAAAIVRIGQALRGAATSFVQVKKPVRVQKVSANAMASGAVSVRPGKVEVAYDRYGPIPHGFTSLAMHYSFDGKTFTPMKKFAKAGRATKFELEVPRGAKKVELYFVPTPSNGNDIDSNGGYEKNFVLTVR